MEAFHKRLKRLRVSKGLTIKELCQKIEVPVSTYREWEYGGKLTGPPFIKLAEVLGVPLTTVMTGAETDSEWLLDELKGLEAQIVTLRTQIVLRI